MKSVWEGSTKNHYNYKAGVVQIYISTNSQLKMRRVDTRSLVDIYLPSLICALA